MTTGTTMGEMSTAITAARAGKFGRAKPSAATVPRVVANIVLKKAMMMLFLTAVVHRSFRKKSSYHRNDQWPRGNERNELSLKLIGTTIRIGDMRNSNTSPQNT